MSDPAAAPVEPRPAASVVIVRDAASGAPEPLEVWMAHDIGRSINPALVMGQVEGSVYMGLGEAMMEESAFRRLPKARSHALVHKFPSVLEYKSLTFEEMPKVHTYLIEEPDPAGPYGAKGAGEAGTAGAPGA